MGAFCNPLRDHTLNAVELDLGDNGADIDSLVERRTHAQHAHAIANLRQQSICDALLHQQARAGTAYLPLIEPDPVHQPFDCAVEVSILENDKGRFASQFE